MIACPKCHSDEHLEYVELAIIHAPVTFEGPDLLVVGKYEIDLENTSHAQLHCTECQIHFAVPGHDDVRITWKAHPELAPGSATEMAFLDSVRRGNPV